MDPYEIAALFTSILAIIITGLGVYNSNYRNGSLEFFRPTFVSWFILDAEHIMVFLPVALSNSGVKAKSVRLGMVLNDMYALKETYKLPSIKLIPPSKFDKNSILRNMQMCLPVIVPGSSYVEEVIGFLGSFKATDNGTPHVDLFSRQDSEGWVPRKRISVMLPEEGTYRLLIASVPKGTAEDGGVGESPQGEIERIDRIKVSESFGISYEPNDLLA